LTLQVLKTLQILISNSSFLLCEGFGRRQDQLAYAIEKFRTIIHHLYWLIPKRKWRAFRKFGAQVAELLIVAEASIDLRVGQRELLEQIRGTCLLGMSGA